MNTIGNKMFAYIDNHSELTQSMVNQYNDSLIFLGDEKQIFVPVINAYVGIGQSAYNYLLSRIGDSNNNITEYDKYIHKDTVTGIYAQFSPTELEVYRNGTAGGSNHSVTVRGETINTEAISYSIFKANTNVVLKGLNDYDLTNGKDELGRTVSTSYTSGINVTINHSSNAHTGVYTINGVDYTYTYYDPYDVITIDDTKTWSYIKSSNSYLINFTTRFASDQANRIYKNLLGVSDGQSVYIEKDFDEAFNWSDDTKQLTVFDDVYVKMKDGSFNPVTVENENDANGGFVIKVKDSQNVDQIIYTINSTQTKLTNDQLKALLAGPDNGGAGLYGGYVTISGNVIPVWYHRNNDTSASSQINIADGIQTLKEVANILDQITDGTQDDGINLAYNIAWNHDRIIDLQEWKNGIGNETVSSFKSESRNNLLTVNYYSTNLWDKDRVSPDGASIGKVKLDLDLRLAQTYELGGVTYAAYLSDHNVPAGNLTYFIYKGDRTDINNYREISSSNRNELAQLLQKQDPSLTNSSSISIYTISRDSVTNDIIEATESSTTLSSFKNASNTAGLNGKYIFFPYEEKDYVFNTGLTDVHWVTTYVGWAYNELANRITSVNGDIQDLIQTTIQGLDKPDTEVAGQYVSQVTETDGIITVTRKKLPLDTILKNDVFYTHDVYLHISSADAKNSNYSNSIYRLENGQYTKIPQNNINSIGTEGIYDDIYYKTSLASMTAVAANTSVNDMILNAGNVSYFKKQTTHGGSRIEYLPIDIHLAYTSGTLFTNDKVTAGDTIYYWNGVVHNSKYFDVGTVQLSDGSTTTLFTSYITYLAASSEYNTGLADAWDVRRTIESMFQWVNIKTNKIIS